jgi:hypothetical protein
VDAEALRPRSLAARGAVEEAFQRHLFEEPFGPGFYSGYVASAGLVKVNATPSFVPSPPTAGVRDPALVPAAQAASAKVASVGFREGDDLFLDHLVAWAMDRARAGDAIETRRTLAAIDARLGVSAVDGPLVERKLRHARAALSELPARAQSSVERDLDEAAFLLHQGEVGRANEIANRVLDTAAARRPRRSGEAP